MERLKCKEQGIESGINPVNIFQDLKNARQSLLFT